MRGSASRCFYARYAINSENGYFLPTRLAKPVYFTVTHVTQEGTTAARTAVAYHTHNFRRLEKGIIEKFEKRFLVNYEV